MQNDEKLDLFSQIVKLLGVLPLLLAVYWSVTSGSNSLVLFLFAISSVAIIAHYICGYSLARWLIGIFAIVYCAFQVYLFFPLLGASSLTLIYFLMFVVLFFNGFFLLFSKKISTSFAIKRQGLSSASLTRLKLLLWLAIAMLAVLLIRDVVRLLI